MYKLSVPITNDLFVGKNRAIYLKQFLDCGVDRVLLAVHSPFADKKELQKTVALLRENATVLREHGIEPAVWVATTIGHGGPLAGDLGKTEQLGYQPLVTIDGQAISNTGCPYDETFQALQQKIFAGIAESGIKLIFLDDDFRLSQHAKNLCCTCDLHMKRMEELCGERLDRKDLRTLLFSGSPNKYRDAWLKAQGDSLKLLATKLREAVDTVDEEISLALCTAHCPWDMDGADPRELTRILAGRNAPVLRLHGAPYWALHSEKPLSSVFEIARMFSSFCREEHFELLAEGDCYPRPRSSTPASYLELFDGVIRGDGGHHGILKYMFDYVSDPQYETGYVESHLRDLPDLRALGDAFGGGADTGVRVWIQPNLLGVSDFSLSTVSDQAPYPWGGILLGSCGIPTVYRGKGICSVIFGQVAQVLEPDTYEDGAILDATAATLLARKGIDVGCSSEGEWVTGAVSTLSDRDSSYTVFRTSARIRVAELSPKAELCLSITVDGTTLPYAYRYENEQGQRFLVYLLDSSALARTNGLMQGYVNQSLLQDAVSWIARKPLSFTSKPHAGLYTLCKQTEDTLTIGFFNCWADPIWNPVFSLSEAYTLAEGIRCDASLDGKELRLSTIPPFNFAVVTLKKY